MNELIAVVEDEPDIRDLVSLHLKKEGFQVEGFESARPLFRSLEKRRPALIILDLMLPDMDGLDICRALKKRDDWASVPIIILTAKSTETDKVLGLELGADDYLTKPFSPKELVARVRAVLRRPVRAAGSKQLTAGQGLVLDTGRHEVTVKGKKVELTPVEFKILELLASNKGRAFSRDQILDHLWGQEKFVVDRTVDVHIRNLRAKLGEAASLISNVRGVGYKLEE
jgi:DNA-binding response OmpR family regulator